MPVKVLVEVGSARTAGMDDERDKGLARDCQRQNRSKIEAKQAVTCRGLGCHPTKLTLDRERV
jgi:hypothetical protein